MSKLMWFLARFMATALLGVIVLMVLGWGGAQAQAQGQAQGQARVQTQVLSPPMAAALVAVCSGQPCLVKMPDKLHDPIAPPQNKSRKRLTRRST